MTTNQRIEFIGKFGKPTIQLPEDFTNTNSRLLVLEGAFDVKYISTDDHEVGELQIYGVTAYISRLNERTLIIEPIKLNCTLESFSDDEERKRKISLSIDQGGISRVSYQDMKLIFDIVRGFRPKKETVIPVLQTQQQQDDDEEDDAISELPIVETRERSPSSSVMDIIQKDIIDKLENQRSNIFITFKTGIHDLSILVVDDIRVSFDNIHSLIMTGI